MSGLTRTPGTVQLGFRLGLVAALSGLGFAAVPIVLGDVRDDLGLTEGQSASVMTAFTLGLALTAAVAGRLVDAVGARRTFELSALVLVVGTAIAATSSDLAPLVAGRLLQGVGASGASLAAFATPSAVLAPERTAMAQGVLTATSVVCLGLGPVIGAGLAALGSWRLALLAPAGVVVLAPFVVRYFSSRPGTPTPFDGRGAALVAAVTTALTLLAQGPGIDLTWAALGVLALVAIVLGTAVVRHVARYPDGFVPQGMLRDRRPLTLALAAAACFGAYLVLALLIPLEMKRDTGWSNLTIGVVLLPAAVAAAMGALLTGRWIPRRGAASALTILAPLGAVGMLVGAITPAPIGLVVAMAAGIAAFAGGQVALMEGIPLLVRTADRGVALGIGNLTFLSGGTMGAALAASLAEAVGARAALAILAPLPVLGGLAALTMITRTRRFAR